MKLADFKKRNIEKHKDLKIFLEKQTKKLNKPKIRKTPPRAAKELAKVKIAITQQEALGVEISEKVIEWVGDHDIFLNGMLADMSTLQREILAAGLSDNGSLAKYKGCRKAKYFSQATIARTKGLNILMMAAGLCIKLREEIVRETPTSIILDIVDSLTNNETAINYANRIEAIGYDFMCRIYYH